MGQRVVSLSVNTTVAFRVQVHAVGIFFRNVAAEWRKATSQDETRVGASHTQWTLVTLVSSSLGACRRWIEIEHSAADI
eukprot:891836-Amphidinium_carterae.1